MTTLTDAVRTAIQYQLTNVHTAMPATFISFDESDRSATVQPSINKNYLDGSEAKLPIIHKVPVIFPLAGSASITFPINPGDFCLLIMCERSLEEWKRLGINQKPIDRRKFNLSDAIAIPGLIPFGESMPAIGSDFSFRYGNSSITITESGEIQINSGNQLTSINAGGEINIEAGTDVNITANGLITGTVRLDGSGIAIGNSALGIELLNSIQTMCNLVVTIAATPPFTPLATPFGNLAAEIALIKGTL